MVMYRTVYCYIRIYCLLVIDYTVVLQSGFCYYRLYKKEEDNMVDNLDIDTGFTDEELFEYLIDHDVDVDMPPKNVYKVNAVISYSNIRGDIIC